MKISIVGGGNAGCFTALYLSWYKSSHNIEVELIHNPDVPPVTVGQGTLPGALKILHNTTRFNWYNNKIHATPKTGFLYEDWGKVNDKVFHPFPADRMSMHFCPCELQNHIINSGRFKVVEDDVDPKDVDADYVFDARGTPSDITGYIKLINPINSVILGRPKWDSMDLWTRSVATPDGWTFVIPMDPSSPSYDGAIGYLYNNEITNIEDAENNFRELFDVEVTRHLIFDSYVTRNPVVDNRIISQGNRLFFLEPLEATAVESYLYWSKAILYAITNRIPLSKLSNHITEYIRRVQNFILWHYQFGSKYDTPFWEYAKSLSFVDSEFNRFLETSINMDWDEAINIDNIDDKSLYAQWTAFSCKYWYEGMNIYK